MREEQTLLQQDLRERGWTTAMIHDLAPMPQIVPRYGGGHYCRYPRAKIERIEKTALWKAARRKAQPARERALKVAERKRNETLSFVETFPFDLRVPPNPIGRAIDAYNSAEQRERDESFAHEGDDPQFLRRITANYLRHECSNYDELLTNIRGRVGTGEAYQAFRKRINAQIETAVAEALAKHRTT